jgi:pilus assembly protein FimV
LLEVYAKRRDIKGFEQLAIQLYAETHGVGDDWAKAQELGRQIDADNPLYHPGGAPAPSASGHEIHPEPMDASTLPHTVNANAPESAADAFSRSGPDTGPMSGFDLDLDLDLAAPDHAASMAATQAMPATVEQAPFTMDFDLPPDSSGETTRPDMLLALDGPSDDGFATPAQPGLDNSLDFDLSDIELSLPSAATGAVPQAIAFPNSSAADTAADQLAQALEELGDDDGDPLLRQLELADEFRQIGDTEGAREVLQELIAKATGPLRDKAQQMLNALR